MWKLVYLPRQLAWPMRRDHVAGNHRTAHGFSGDTLRKWDTLAYEIWMTPQASNIGFGWWSHDIGGFSGYANVLLWIHQCFPMDSPGVQMLFYLLCTMELWRSRVEQSLYLKHTLSCFWMSDRIINWLLLYLTGPALVQILTGQRGKGCRIIFWPSVEDQWLNCQWFLSILLRFELGQTLYGCSLNWVTHIYVEFILFYSQLCTGITHACLACLVLPAVLSTKKITQRARNYSCGGCSLPRGRQSFARTVGRWQHCASRKCQQ